MYRCMQLMYYLVLYLLGIVLGMVLGLGLGYGVILQNFTVYINTRGTISTQRGTL